MIYSKPISFVKSASKIHGYLIAIKLKKKIKSRFKISFLNKYECMIGYMLILVIREVSKIHCYAMDCQSVSSFRCNLFVKNTTMDRMKNITTDHHSISYLL